MVKAADALVLAREAIYHVSAEFDVKATFVPKPFLQELASGAHTHVSVQTREGENLFKVRPEDGNAFLAGVFGNLPNMVLILAPTGNSYERLRPSCWTGTFHCMGMENKEAAIRLVKEGSVLERFEIKSSDGCSNPYLLLGSVIGAGLEGLKNGCSLPPEVDVDPASFPEDKQPPRLPSTLSEAIKCFEGNEFNRELYGEKLHELIVKMRAKELEFWERETTEARMKMLLQRY